MSKDYYAALGVAKTATPEEIKKAFRAKAHQYHPDKKGGDEAKFKEANEAYQVLSDPSKRAKYDQFGSGFDQAGGGGAGGFNWQDFAGQGGFNSGNMHFDFGDVGDIGDMFGDLFGMGGRGRQRRASRGEDMEIAIDVPFMDAVNGSERTIRIEKQINCERCHGSGAEPGSNVNSCKTCHGRGQVERIQQSILGAMRTVVVCPDCHGQGKKPDKPCRDCDGKGVRFGTDTVTIKVPAGIDNGQRIKFAGRGQAASNVSAGDLYVHINVRSDKRWGRDGDTIHTIQRISFRQAALGDKVNVETVHGPVIFKIPEGTQTGTVFTLKSKGMPRLGRPGSYGDHLVTVLVVTPTRLSRTQKKALEEVG